MGSISLLTLNRGRDLFLPAHGRGRALPRDLKKLLNKRAGIWDLPELPDIGGPLCSTGSIASSQEKSASDFEADYCWYGVNGATGMLQAALLALVRPKKAVLMPRNVHRSLIQACILGDIQPVLFDVPYLADRGHYYPQDLLWLNKVLEAVTSIDVELSAAVLVNPTYHGYSTDLKAQIDRLHQFGLPVLVDEAHGTYFASNLAEGHPVSALKAGADIVVHSLHKSSVGLVQTAVLWSQGEMVDPLSIQRSLGLFQTTSPSSLLLASCEFALRDMKSKSGEDKLISQLAYASDLYQTLLSKGLPFLRTDDPLRLILHTSSKGISGFEADSWFIERGIVGELPEAGTLSFCLGFHSHRGLVRAITKVWNGLIAAKPLSNIYPPFQSPCFPFLTIPNIPCCQASREPSHLVLLNEASHLVSADLICPYPPGIPVVIPGELLNKSRIEWMIEQNKLWPNQIPSQLRVIS